MVRFALVLFMFLGIFLTSCVGEGGAENESENNEVNEIAKQEFFQQIFNDGEVPNQEFLIQAGRDTLLVTENGTQVKINGNTFTNQNGERTEGEVDIEIKEAFDMIDIVMGNLITVSDGNFLQTDGMIYINASQNNLDLVIEQGKSVGVIVAAEDVDSKMEIFSGEVVDGIVEWGNPEEPLNEIMQEITQETMWVWYQYEGMDSIEMQNYYKDSLINWFWSPEREVGDVHRNGAKKVWITDFTSEIDTIRFKEMEDGLFIQEVITSRGSNSYIQDFNTSYIFTMKELGWANIDRFFNDPEAEAVDLMVVVSNEVEFGFVYTTLIFKDESMYLPGYQREDRTFGFTQKDWETPVLPINAEGILLGTAYKDDKLHYAIMPFSVENKLNLTLELKPSTLQVMKDDLETYL